MVWLYRVCLLGALVAGGCAKAGTVGDGGGVGGNGVGGGDFSVAADLTFTPDLTPFCGDGVCSAANGEACDNCPSDCGACAGCAAGFADCNHNPADGCETNLGTPDNCGGCGHVCQQTGGTNACVPSGTSFVCKPTCDATHADCNMIADDGCEVDLTGPNNCGACGHACTNPNGNTICTTQGSGWFCNPTCNAGWGFCGGDPSQGCLVNLGNNPDHCGDCNRPCASNGVASRACTNGVCTPTCAAPYSDCSDPAAPGADDGCETNGTTDPGEYDGSCGSPQAFTDGEGATVTSSTSRLLPAGDVDDYHVHFSEGSHTCFPGTSQAYTAIAYIIRPANTDYLLQVNTSTCNNTWTTYNSTGICVAWCGTCGASDDRDIYFQVYSPSGANSCGDYTITWQYAPEGQAPSGCVVPSC